MSRKEITALQDSERAKLTAAIEEKKKFELMLAMVGKKLYVFTSLMETIYKILS